MAPHTGRRRLMPANPPLALHAQNCFDGVSLSFLQGVTVLISNGIIVDVRSGRLSPRGYELATFDDATVIPGLVDAHVHLTFGGEPEVLDRTLSRTPRQILDLMRHAAEVTLWSGVTTIRDLGDKSFLSLQLRTETASTMESGPEIVVAGPPITTPGGHCWFLGGEAAGPEGIRSAIRERADRGVDVVKVMASGGHLTPGSRPWQSQYSLDELRLAVVEAHASGLPITAHAHGVESISFAIRAGVDMVEHCSFQTSTGISPDDRLIAEIANAETMVCTTTGFHPAGPPLSAEAEERTTAVLAAAMVMHSRGIPVVCASDAGISAQKPHGLLPFAAARMEAAGMASLDVLRAVTSLAAQACRLGSRKGRIATGYDADMVVLRSNPLRGVGALREIAAVYRSGRRVR
jgi:imidazolonepropionase-like amidohydrolase